MLVILGEWSYRAPQPISEKLALTERSSHRLLPFSLGAFFWNLDQCSSFHFCCIIIGLGSFLVSPLSSRGYVTFLFNKLKVTMKNVATGSLEVDEGEQKVPGVNTPPRSRGQEDSTPWQTEARLLSLPLSTGPIIPGCLVPRRASPRQQADMHELSL